MVASIKQYDDFNNLSQDYFYCKRLSCIMRRSLCIEYQNMASKVDKGSYGHGLNIAYNRWLSCHDCPQGREISDIGKPKHKSHSIPKAIKKREKSVLSIDWNEMLKAVNNQLGTKYVTPKTMLQSLYKNRSKRAMCRLLGVSEGSLNRAMRERGIKSKGQPKKRVKPKPPIRQETPVWDKPLCSECGKYAAVAKGMCASCYRKAKRGSKI